MSNVNITKDEIMAVFPKVTEILADALACKLNKVKLDSSLIDDLGSESIDFLDIVFRLERAFKVKIPRGRILEEARGELSGDALRVVAPRVVASRALGRGTVGDDDHLQRDGSLEPRIERFVDLAHPALAQKAADLVGADEVSRLEHRGVTTRLPAKFL